MNGNTNKLLGMPARSVLPLSIGIAMAWTFPEALTMGRCAFIICASALLTLATNRIHALSSISTYVTATAIGAFLMSNTLSNLVWSGNGEYDKYDAVLTNTPERHGKTWRMNAIVTSIAGKKNKPFKLRLTILHPNENIPFNVGDGIECISILKEPNGRNTKNFNYRRYMKSQGFKAETFAYFDNVEKKNINTENIPLKNLLGIKLYKYRKKLTKAYSSMGIAEDNLATLSALTLGDRSMLTKSVKESYSIAGASHILALSGLHLGIIYYILTLLMWPKNKLWWWRIIAKILLMTTIWGYVALVGMPISAIRSATMLTICSIVDISNRETNPLNTILTATAIILAINPISLFDVGFQMSVITVISISTLSQPLYALLEKTYSNSKPLNCIFKISATSISAQIGVMPLTAYYFGRVSCWFLLSNLIMIPLATILLYGSIIMFVCAFAPSIQSIVAYSIERTAELMNHSVQIIASLPGASIENIEINSIQVACVYIAMTALLAIRNTFVERHAITPFSIPYSTEES